MTNEELTNYYADLLILQYRGKPKAYDTVQAVIRALIVFNVMELMREGYSIDTAIGRQQDIIGKYLGVSRTITGIAIDRSYFWMIRYDQDPAVENRDGFALYGEDTGEIRWLSYAESALSLFDLTDEEYRTIQRLKIILNSSNLSTYNTDRLVNELFDGNVEFTDNGDMSINYTFPADQERLVTIAQSQGLIPRAMGVSLTINYV